MSQLQVNQVKDKAKKKETKRSNHQTVIKNHWFTRFIYLS
jgi:hypothetical protein